MELHQTAKPSTNAKSYRAVLLQLDTPNRNGSIIPTDVAKQLLKSKDPFRKAVDGGYMLGELTTPRTRPEGMSDEDWRKRIVQVDPNEVCLQITHPRIEGKELVGVVTPFGPKAAELQKLLLEGTEPQVAFRGLTSRGEDGVVDHIYAVCAFDLVAPTQEG